MPFPPINLHPRISSPGKELFRKKKAGLPDDRESDRDRLAASWQPSHAKPPGRKPSRAPGLRDAESKSSWLPVPKPAAGPGEGMPRSASAESGAHRSNRYSSRSSLGKEEGDELRFSLSLTPEAILVIQKRNLEKQMMAKQQKCCGSADLRHRRVLPSRRGQGGAKGGAPVAKPEGHDDIRAIVKVSLLNDQYKYDDVEYEEEDGDVDETVMRKCKEWLKGVESAAAFGKVDKLSALPHLKS
ncbi:proline-rich protein 18 [Denticeps clupeoides]|uniref:proline-rich protein 18 n=1 Tax=Denticeps clupeoides TaxID=299321 RepID=UPI0010A576D0|nr:proline-rich protein 18 [Denticeps clupeoides]